MNEPYDLSTTLIRGLEVLRCFSNDDRALSNAEISKRLGMNRPKVSRLCKTLVHVGYLRRDTKGLFRLAPNMLSLVYPCLSAMSWRHDASEIMNEVAAMTGGSITISVMSGDRFVQIKTVGHKVGYPHVPEIGLNGPLLRSSTGRALLSLLDGQELLDKMDELSVCDPEGFAESKDLTLSAIEECRTRGFCVSYGEWRPNIVAAAAPLGQTEDGLHAALACGMPRFRVVEDKFDSDIGPRLASMADALRAKGLFS